MMTAIRREALNALRPPMRLRLSEWIEGNLVLPQGTTAEPGRVRLWKPQRGIADAISDPFIETVSVIKATRVGYSTLLTATIANFVTNDPSGLLLLLPTEADARDYVVSELEPIFDATPAVAGALSAEADESGRNTLLSRRFPGGFLKVVPARAPRNLRRHTVRVLLVDEEDGMEPTSEGDPFTLAKRRTDSFADRKIVRGSTPTDADTSTIIAAYAESDRRIFEVWCPACSERHAVEWKAIRWPANRPQEAVWVCPGCERSIEERHKLDMVEGGEWRARSPEVVGHAGFHQNALVSLLPNARWGKLAEEFLRSHDDPDRLRVFVNTILAEGWSVGGEEISDAALIERAEAFGLNVEHEGKILPFPAEVLYVTAGLDVQDDRIEATIVGWDRTGAAWVLGHFVIYGSPEQGETWREVDELLLTRWQHPLGNKIGIDAAAVDSGDGGWTDQVYSFCWPRMRRRVMAIKGQYGSNRPAIEMSRGKVGQGALAGKGRLWIVGVDNVKQAITTRLTRDPHLIRFSASLSPVWFEQLVSERRVVKRVAGRPVRRFERIGSMAAEALDCLTYAFAARNVLVVAPDAREVELSTPPSATVAPPRPTPRPGSFPRQRGGWLQPRR